ncbi:hypothetical protein APED_19305 [Acanthopleuribacter pedis]
MFELSKSDISVVLHSLSVYKDWLEFETPGWTDHYRELCLEPVNRVMLLLKSYNDGMKDTDLKGR